MTADPFLEACAMERETDIGNGRRFRLRFGDLSPSTMAIAVAHVGWHVFDGMRWKEDEDESLIRRLAHEAAVRIADEPAIMKATPTEREKIDAAEVAAEALAELQKVAEPGDDVKAERLALARTIAEGDAARRAAADRRKGRARHAKSSAGSSKISNMLTEAAPYLARRVDDLNLDRLAVNCLTGTIRFVQEEDEESDPDDPRMRWIARLDPHSQADYMTKCANAKWSPDAAPDCPEFLRFLAQVQPDQAMRAFLKRYFGYCLTGLTVEQAFLFFYGVGRNGKSTFVDLMLHVFADYAVTLSIDSFSGEARRGGGEATPDLARLPGARLVVAAEPESNVKLKDALIKQLTGGEKIPVRRLHRDFFEVDPQFKIAISGNHEPRVDDDSDGIWRRLKKTPWAVQIPQEQVDKRLLARLKKEADGVFAWLVEGALEWLSDPDGLKEPQAVADATQAYRDQQDAIGSFIRVAVDVTGDADHTEKPLDLFMAFERAADAEGFFKLQRPTFEKRFAKAAEKFWPAGDGRMVRFSKAKRVGQTLYLGLRIRPDFLPRDDGQHGGYR